MGCSSSRQVDATEDHPQIASSPTAHALTHPTSRSALAPNSASQSAIHHPSPRSNLSSPRHSSNSYRRPGVPSTTKHHNVPLESTKPFATTEAWSTSRLNREREDFFTTRVTGRPEVWSAIRFACELAREGQIENARGILDASGVTLPTGSLIDGGYDEVGNLYKVPNWCLATPENLQKEVEQPQTDIDGEETTVARTASKKIAIAETGETGIIGDAEKTAADARRDEKGKGRAVADVDAINVCCRLSDRGGPDVIIALGRGQPVSILARRVKDEANIPSTAHIRAAYLGKILNGKETLAAQGWKEGHVIQALVVGQTMDNSS